MNLRKVKKILQSETAEFFNLNISLSTIENFNHLNALVIFNNTNADIIVNANNCKTDEQIIKAIAHEMAHIKLGTNTHYRNHKNLWEQIEQKITEEL